MNILEKDIEQLIYEGYINDNTLFDKRGLPGLRGIVFRQFRVDPYGTIDLLFIERRISHAGGEDFKYLNFKILELKKDKIDINAVMQACRYATAIKRLIVNRHNISNHCIQANITLIGKDVCTNGDFVYLLNQFDYGVDIYTYSLDVINGLMFHHLANGWYNKKETKEHIITMDSVRSVVAYTDRIKEEKIFHPQDN